MERLRTCCESCFSEEIRLTRGHVATPQASYRTLKCIRIGRFIVVLELRSDLTLLLMNRFLIRASLFRIRSYNLGAKGAG